MNREIKEHWLALLVLIPCAIVLLYHVFHSEGWNGGADSIQHYQIARYAFDHPEKFLSHWGKPIFTLLSAPFAQFGFKGMETFNVLVNLGTAWFAFLLARHFKFRFAWFVPVLVLFTPLTFATNFSGLTSPLFTLFLFVGTYFFIKQKYWTATLLWSALILIRTEGIVILPVLIALTAYHKQWKPLLGFLAIPFIYSCIGSVAHHHDFFWIITKSPYGGSTLYETGELLHYWNNLDGILGNIVLWLLPLATLVFVGYVALKKRPFSLKKESVLIALLVCALLYTAAHSYVWWKGGNAAAGLLRVVGAVTPIFALFAAFSFQWMPGKTWWYMPLFFFLGLHLGKEANVHEPIPYQADFEARTVQKAVEWLAHSEYSDQKVFYFNPLYCFYRNSDPDDWYANVWGYEPLNHLPDSGIVFWDAHFAPMEGRVDLIELAKSNQAHAVARFDTEHEHFVKSGHYEIALFQKRELLENKWLTLRTETLPDSGAVHHFGGSNEGWSPAIQVTFPDLPFSNFHTVTAKIDVEAENAATANSISLLITVERPGQVYRYIATYAQPIEGWQTLEQTIPLPSQRSPEDYIKIYAYSANGEPAKAKNLVVTFEGTETPLGPAASFRYDF